MATISNMQAKITNTVNYGRFLVKKSLVLPQAAALLMYKFDDFNYQTALKLSATEKISKLYINETSVWCNTDGTCFYWLHFIETDDCSLDVGCPVLPKQLVFRAACKIYNCLHSKLQ